MVPPSSELSSTCVQPPIVVRYISMLERHSCPGASTPVQANGDSSIFHSGSILISIVSLCPKPCTSTLGECYLLSIWSSPNNSSSTLGSGEGDGGMFAGGDVGGCCLISSG